MKPIATPSRTHEILEKYGLYAKKKYGQNFIIEPSIIERIVRQAHLDKECAVIEIGPGIGALSEKLSETCGYVQAYDIDQDMVEILNDVLSDKDNFHVECQDFLKVDLAQLLASLPYRRIKIVANLPYYITSKLLEKIALEGQGIEEVIVMVQKDVAIKMTQKTGLKDRLPLTLLLEKIADVEILFEVPRTVFKPAPNVDSAILKISFRTQEPRQAFYEFLKLAFTSRRKTIGNNLKKAEFKQPLAVLLEKMAYPQDVRAESMSVEDLYRLFQACTKF